MVGVYKITNKINGKVYVGQSKSIGQRWANHINRLECGKHINKELQSDFNKYGYNNFYFEILEECEEDNLLDCETKHINNYNNNSYNILKNNKLKCTKINDKIGFLINSNIYKKINKDMAKLAIHLILIAYKYLNEDNYIELTANQISKEFNITSDSLYRDSYKITKSLNNTSIFKNVNYIDGCYLLEFNDEYLTTDIYLNYNYNWYKTITNNNSLKLLINLIKNKQVYYNIEEFKTFFNVKKDSYNNYGALREYQIDPIINNLKKYRQKY